MSVLHIDIFSIGAQVLFTRDKSYLTAACGVNTFAVGEAVPKCNSKTFAQALISEMLRYGMVDIIVLDQDSRLFRKISTNL